MFSLSKRFDCLVNTGVKEGKITLNRGMWKKCRGYYLLLE